MEKIVKNAFINSIGTVVYIALVASFMFFMQDIMPKEDTIFIMISILLLFVSSAAITGFLVFGKPIMLYIDGKKKEAVRMLIYTIFIILLITLLFFGFLIAFKSF